MEVSVATATTLDANYTINDTSITVVSTSNWPTATGIIFAIDVVDSNGEQVAGTYNEYEGVVSSATSITSVDHHNGTDRNYSAGATTRVYIPVSAERENRIVTWGTTQHKQDGTHANTITTDTINENTAANGITIDGLNIKDSKLTTADSVVTANYTDGSVLPEHLVTSSGTSWAWQTWAPTYANITVGGGTLVARYNIIGKTVFCEWNLLCNVGTTSVGSSITISLPVTAAARYANMDRHSVGLATAVDDTTKVWGGVAMIDNSTSVVAIRWDDGTGGLDTTIPFTEVTGDTFSATWTYEAA
jgi:hypothetical protein